MAVPNSSKLFLGWTSDGDDAVHIIECLAGRFDRCEDVVDCTIDGLRIILLLCAWSS
jgi:hypothetical protein